MAKRITYIDTARAICIILVVIYHYTPENAPSWYVGFNHIAQSFRMPLLLFVSGYIYAAVQKPMAYKDFVFNKFKRLIVPYLFVSIVIIAVKLLTEKDMHLENPVSVSSFYEMFYFPSAAFFLWFVYALFLIFMIVPFINTPRKLNIFLILSLAFLLIPVDFQGLFYPAQLKCHLFYFALGWFICARPNIKLIIDKIPTVAFFVFYVALYIFKSNTYIPISLLPFINLFLAVSGIFFIIRSAMYIDIKPGLMKRVLTGLSAYTYTIYLLHTTAEGFAKSIVLKIPIENYLSPELCFIANAFIIITCGVAAPVILHKIIVSRSKILSFLIGIKYLSPHPPPPHPVSR